MISYLLNISAIWLLSLLCFDLFLKREAYHGMNRAYLLITLIMGIVIPLFTWPQAAAQSTYVQVVRQPLYTPVTHIRQAVAQAVTMPQQSSKFSFNPATLVRYVYYMGVFFSLALLAKNAWQLLLYYRSGRRYKDGRWHIVETGRKHGPFSFAHIIFVSSKAGYNADEWQIVLQHEQQHGRMLHLADLLLIELLRAALWFHPLVYLYRRRLLLVHEYQADAAASLQPAHYGHFLIEQSILQQAPLLTHSFNRSPIHKRIYMLTHNQAPQTHFMKLLVIIPVIALSFVCCTNATKKDTSSLKPSGAGVTKTVQFKNNRIVIKETPMAGFNTGISGTDSIHRIYPKLITMETLNGQKIFAWDEVDQQPAITGSESFASYLFDYVKDDLQELPDGYYTFAFGQLLLDEYGKIGYYNIEHAGFDATSKKTAGISIKNVNSKAVIYLEQDIKELKASADVAPAAKEKMNEKLAIALDKVVFTPAVKNGRNVPVELLCTGGLSTRLYHVKDHKATLEDFDTSNTGRDTLRL